MLSFLCLGLVWMLSTSCGDTASGITATEAKINESLQKSDTLEWKKKRLWGQDTTYINFFSFMYDPYEKVLFKDAHKYSEILYDPIGNKYFGYLINPEFVGSRPDVHGWHPYWQTDSYKSYRYSLFSTISFFAYDVNEFDGTYNDSDAIKAWRSTPLIDSAHKHNVSMLLTVTSYDSARNEKFLQNTKAWATLADSLNVLLKERKADGVDLDFWPIPKDRKANFLSFINALRSKLGDSCLINVQISPEAVMNDNIAMYTSLQNRVNNFVIQGYNHRKVPKRFVAPLYAPNNEECIARTVDLYLKKGLEADKITLALPLFGYVHKKKDTTMMSYANIVSVYEKNKSPQIDLWSRSTYIDFDSMKVYYESHESIKYKLAWARENKLKGVGFWGLGYDEANTELWHSVMKGLGAVTVVELTPLKTNNGLLYSSMEQLYRYKKTAGKILFSMVLFFVFGLALSLLDWRVREIFFRTYINQVALFLLLVILLMISWTWLSAKEQSTDSFYVTFLSGMALGSFIVFLITRFYIAYRKKMP